VFRITIKYLQYLFSSVGPHGVHSPFVYHLLTQVINDKTEYPAYKKVEQLRKELLRNQQQVTLQDFGAGGERNAEYKRSIAKIAKTSAKPAKYAQLLYRLCQYHKPKYMLELGTSLGVSTAYQAMGANRGNDIEFITLEGSEQVAKLAQKNFETLGIEKSIQVGVGNFDETLENHLSKFKQLDYVFFDGNHRYQPTINYFNQCLPLAYGGSLFIFDDIRWSKEMEKAWEEIKNHPQVTVTIDLFFIGLVYFKKDQTKQHFQLRF
jgi:predicted O-methyltransferase YrrM